MTGHVFISYSHAADAAYVERLAGFLVGAGVATWFDREIISGDRWDEVIPERIESCAAFVVVMSPTAEKSRWVKREINHAEKLGKPILPLLLAGDVFFRLSDVQYENVTGGLMPSPAYIARLSGWVPFSPPSLLTSKEMPSAPQWVGPSKPQWVDPSGQRVQELRRSFLLRRFGSGYDPAQVDRLFDGVTDFLAGRSLWGDLYLDLDPNQFSLVPGGYFQAEVDAALSEVSDIIQRKR